MWKWRMKFKKGAEWLVVGVFLFIFFFFWFFFFLQKMAMRFPNLASVEVFCFSFFLIFSPSFQ